MKWAYEARSFITSYSAVDEAAHKTSAVNDALIDRLTD
jgi:hypothetical protein